MTDDDTPPELIPNLTLRLVRDTRADMLKLIAWIEATSGRVDQLDSGVAALGPRVDALADDLGGRVDDLRGRVDALAADLGGRVDDLRGRVDALADDLGGRVHALEREDRNDG